MPDTKTSNESAATTLNGTELLRGVQSSANVKITTAQIRTYCEQSIPFTIATDVVTAASYCVGDGVTDVTLPLQNAIFAAFARPVTYHNVTIDLGAGAFVNWTGHGLVGDEPVVFTGTLPSPLVAGLVYKPIASTLTANKFQIANAAGGSAIATSGSGSGISAGVAYAYYPLSAPVTQRALYIPPGYYITSHPLHFPKSLYGGLVSGAGQFITTISNTAGTSTFASDGLEFSTFENMNIYATGTSGPTEGVCCFDSNWNGAGQGNNQRNTFRNIRFGGGEYGVRMGWGGAQCDTTSGIDCFFEVHTIAGWSTWNFNALGCNLIGGNMSSCEVGAYFAEGTGSIYGTFFEGSADYDIRYSTGSAPGNGAIVSGVRTESHNFVDAHSCQYPVAIVGCGQDNNPNDADDVFVYGGLFTSLSGCSSYGGKVKATNGMSIDASDFGRDDFLITAASDFTAKPVMVRRIRANNTQYENGYFVGGGGTTIGNFIPHNPNPIAYTKAQLPAASTWPAHVLAWVTDSNSAVVGNDSSSFGGGGTHLVLCENSGSVWTIILVAS